MSQMVACPPGVYPNLDNFLVNSLSRGRREPKASIPEEDFFYPSLDSNFKYWQESG